MSVLSIQSTYPIFTEADGLPLENGYIWLGAANLNPIVNPIAAFFDAALTIPAVQPIRTSGGYPVYQGTPARIYVNSNYSIQVQNKNGSVVYSAPAATERYNEIVISEINANQVIYDPPGSGAIQRDLQSKIRESVSVLDFGADPTGAIDSTLAFQNAHDYCVSTNRYFCVEVPAGTYRQDTRIDWSPFVQVRTLGYVVMECGMASGFAWNISTQFGPASGINGFEDNAFTSLFVGGMEFNAINATNTATCFLLGSSDTATWSQASRIFSIEGIGTTNFQGAVEIGDHCYIVGFKNCHFRGSYDPVRRANTNAIYSRVRNLNDSGTNYVFWQCLFDQLGNAVNTRYTLGRLYLNFESCEFGANERILGLMSSNPAGGNVHTMTDCYYESRFDFGTPACFVNDCELHIKGGSVYAANFTYNNPLFANVTSNGKMTVTGLQTSLENVVANFITGDATSEIYMNGQVIRSGTATPTNWVNTVGNKDWRLEGNALINGRISSNFTPSANWGLDYATSTSVPNLITIANSATYDLAVGSGLVMLTESATGDGAIFFTQGGNTYKIAGSANFDDAIGTVSSVNLYYNAGTLKYRIQNLTGGSITLFVVTIRNRTIS